MAEEQQGGVVSSGEGVKYQPVERRVPNENFDLSATVAGQPVPSVLPPEVPIEAVKQAEPVKEKVAVEIVHPPVPQPMNLNGLRCSNCRENKKESELSIEPLDFFRSDDLTVAPYPISAAVFCGRCKKFLGKFESKLA